MPAASVLIVNYNSGPHLAACLAHLQAQTMRDFEAIVVDNDSVDNSLGIAQRQVEGDGRFCFEAAGRNLGFAAANNRAAAMAGAPWLALLNPDAFAAPDWLEQLLFATQRHPDAAMFGSTQIDAQNADRLDGTGDRYFCLGLAWRGGHGWPVGTLPPEGEIFGPCAAAALYRADAFRAVGGFDETLFCYMEDVDLAFRLRLARQRAVQIPAARVRHIGGGAGGSGEFAIHHGVRNSIWCFAKNMPGSLMWPLLPLHLLAMLLMVLSKAVRGERGGWRGLRDGLAGLVDLWPRRRAVQSARRITALQLMRMLTWNPLALLTRAPPNPGGRSGGG
jgi:N-acetylglucosaminyl-diphospho-decaprenol L-rhamnosyltransferase